MRRNIDTRRLPKAVTSRQGLRRRHVQCRPGKTAVFDGIAEGVLINGGAAAGVKKVSPFFTAAKKFLLKTPSSLPYRAKRKR